MPDKKVGTGHNIFYFFGKEFPRLLPWWGFLGFLLSFVSICLLKFWNFDQITSVFWLSCAVMFVLLTITFVRAFKKMDVEKILLKVKQQELNRIKGEKIELSEFEALQLPTMEKISILGLGSVGKTTLIENLCMKDNENEVTQGSWVYIYNFSQTDYKYAAIFDAPGQNTANQSDLAVKSDFLIILLDHNPLDDEQKIDKSRMENHSSFLNIIKQRLEANNHKPKWIHFLLNKNDLWKDLSLENQHELIDFFSAQIEIFKIGFSSVAVSSGYCAKNDLNLLRELRNKIVKKIL